VRRAVLLLKALDQRYAAIDLHICRRPAGRESQAKRHLLANVLPRLSSNPRRIIRNLFGVSFGSLTPPREIS